jgi:hypothetical protein
MELVVAFVVRALSDEQLDGLEQSVVDAISEDQAEVDETG